MRNKRGNLQPVLSPSCSPPQLLEPTRICSASWRLVFYIHLGKKKMDSWDPPSEGGCDFLVWASFKYKQLLRQKIPQWQAWWMIWHCLLGTWWFAAALWQLKINDPSAQGLTSFMSMLLITILVTELPSFYINPFHFGPKIWSRNMGGIIR